MELRENRISSYVEFTINIYIIWASPGKTDTLKLGTMSPRKGGPSAGTNTALTP